MTLADFGADVIKIEPPDGEIGRRIGPPWIEGESATFMSVNRNKRSLAIDLKTEEGQQALRLMLRKADVLVENFRPGVMAGFGLDYLTVHKLNPDLVYCSISAFGQSGTASQRPGVDGAVQAVSGLMSILGEPGCDPVKVPVPAADMVTGYLAALAILGALHQVRKDQGGQYLDVSLYNCTLMLQQVGFASFFAEHANPQKTGSAAPYAAPNEAFPTADGWIMVAAYHPQRWSALCRLIGREDLARDPRFASNEQRVRHRAELHAQLAESFRATTTAVWEQRMASCDIICAPVRSYQDVVNSDEYADSGITTLIEHPVAGRMTAHGFALGPSQPAPAAVRPAPLLGQHSLEVLRSFEMHSDGIEGLLARGTIRQEVA
jgi:crotonobetainyl-CoA:carnitine CoA-transferase CaiB-like acyl-CoA transferase